MAGTPTPDLLSRVPMFAPLPAGVREAVAGRMVRRSLAAGTLLFRAGEASRGLYLLAEGEIEIFQTAGDGREQVVHIEEPVALVAELPAFDGGPYPASGRARTEAVCFFLSLDDLDRCLSVHPELARVVIRNLGGRLRTMMKLVERISLKSVPARVAATLLDMADATGERRDGGQVRLGCTHEDLAHRLATSRESVARAFGRFRSEGWIETRGRRITLLSVAALEDEAEV